MEEAPKIDRIVSSRGVSVKETAAIMRAYVSRLGSFRPPSGLPDDDGGDGGADDAGEPSSADRKSRREMKEEALLAALAAEEIAVRQLISDDVRERLGLIAESIVAEAEGRELPSVAGRRERDEAKQQDEGGRQVDDARYDEEGADQDGAGIVDADADAGGAEFLAELEEAERVQRERDDEDKDRLASKKKVKKAKKAAKKAKKAAKRRSSAEAEGGEKRIKLEE